MPNISERGELIAARVAAAAAVMVAGYFGVNQPGFVAEVVAFAFGLAASSFFPAIVLGIFWKRANRAGVVSGMLIGLAFTAAYIVYFKFLGGTTVGWWFGISPEGIGAIGMALNFVIAVVVSLVTPPPPRRCRTWWSEFGCHPAPKDQAPCTDPHIGHGSGPHSCSR